MILQIHFGISTGHDPSEEQYLPEVSKVTKQIICHQCSQCFILQVHTLLPDVSSSHHHSACSGLSSHYSQFQDTSKVTKQFTIKVLITTFFRMSSYGKDLHLTRTVVTIVLVFLVLNLPRLVLGVFDISR